jgi:eukaryotic-like serine/threonine-protein kinase
MSSINSTSVLHSALDLSIPRSLFDYDVIDLIGQGAGSLIYVVSDRKSQQLYALKHVVRRTEKDDRFVEQLENEYEVGRQVSHPGLRRAIELKINRTMLRRTIDAALILEVFDGISLEQQVPRELTDVVAAFIQTAQALGALHAAGYVHCDLKPNNILRDSAGNVKVIDLGQAARNGAVKKRIQGTPDYMAPEQVKCQPVTFKTDVFNFGATLYWALCSRKLPTLFTIKKGENSFLVDQQMASPREINPIVPETLSNLVMECVRTNPAKRPEDMVELTRRLELIEHSLLRATRNQPAASRPAHQYRGATANVA